MRYGDELRENERKCTSKMKWKAGRKITMSDYEKRERKIWRKKEKGDRGIDMNYEKEKISWMIQNEKEKNREKV